MRLVLFTDTLHDINGVSRFIRNIGDEAAAAGYDLHILTSTHLAAPPGSSRPYIHNLPPRFSRPMPGYPPLQLALPRRAQMVALAASLRPDAVHVSTPGPVGLLGRRFALRHRLPLLGTYHTDFPAYIDHLFDEPVFTRLCTWHMRWFYRPFARVFTRSLEYAASMERIGIPRPRIVRVLPGSGPSAFDPALRTDAPALWRSLASLGVQPDSAKALYVGRISVEKSLPRLAELWPAVREACAHRGVNAQLLVVGDGPYRAEMQRRLAPHNAAFLGYRHGRELAAIYACSDVFVFPSTTDTLGQVVMEAQCSGLPVIVTDKGGPAEVVRDGVTGFVLPVCNSAKARWRDAIADLLCDSSLRRRMGAAAASTVAPMTISRSFDHFWQVHAESLAHAATSTPRASQR